MYHKVLLRRSLKLQGIGHKSLMRYHTIHRVLSNLNSGGMLHTLLMMYHIQSDENIEDHLYTARWLEEQEQYILYLLSKCFQGNLHHVCKDWECMSQDWYCSCIESFFCSLYAEHMSTHKLLQE